MFNTNQHSNFLRAILDAPNDDLPRLIFADYLEESGEADRAEFIRIQCELAAGCENSERKKPLESRQAELLAKYSEAWRLPIRGPQAFRRGFVDSLWTSADVLLASEPELIVGSTVRTLRITSADKYIDNLAEYRGFERIEHLDLTNNNLAGDYRLRAILGNPHLAKLKGLNLHNNRIWADDVLRIARSPVAIRLTHLDLSGNGIGNEGVSHLANESAFANLEVLNLRSDGLPEYECIDGVGILHLTSFNGDLRLRWLDVADHHIGGEGMVLLCAAAERWGLRYLNVSRNRIGSGGFTNALHELKNTVSPPAIDFARNSISHHEAMCLVHWPPLARIEYFRLTGCEMDSETRAVLLASPQAAKFHLDGDSQ